MPGYGYAEAPKATVAAWTALIHAYLSGRANLARVYVLIDARHGLKDADAAVLKTLDEAAVSYQIVLTKADQVKSPNLSSVSPIRRRRSQNDQRPFRKFSPPRRARVTACRSCAPRSCGW